MRLHLPRLCGAADHRGRKWVDHTHCSVDVGYSVLKDERSVVYTHFQSRGRSREPAPHPHFVSPSPRKKRGARDSRWTYSSSISSGAPKFVQTFCTSSWS